MSGKITFGDTNGGIDISGGNAPVIQTTGNGGQVVIDDITPTTSGTTLSSYQRAVAAGNFTGSETEFYEAQGTAASVYPIVDLPPLP